MLNAYRLALAIMGLSALYAGLLNTVVASGVIEKFYDVQLSSVDVATAVDAQSRILAGMWIAMGIYVLYTIRNFGKHIVPLCFIFLGFALGSVGEFYTMMSQGDMASALPKMLVQVGICAGLSVWGYLAASRQSPPDKEHG